MAADQIAGTIVSLWRYPVKSMQGEELNASAVTQRGLLGDRAFALMDPEGKVASAKNPRKWPNLFAYRAAFTEPPGSSALPPLRITLPAGEAVTSQQPDRDQILSRELGRTVSLHGSGAEKPMLEEYWPEVEGLAHTNAVTDESMPAGTFFDVATVHLLTTATLDRLREAHPQGRYEVRRFRPNIVLAGPAGDRGFIEQGWIGRTLRLGEEVRLRITGPCSRCVMTTLAQADLPADLGILRAVVQHAQSNAGVYASVVRGGRLRRGDVAVLE